MTNTYKNRLVDDEMVSEIKESHLNNIELEKKFLSTLIGNPNLIIEAQETIKQDYFLYNINKAIYVSMQKIAFASSKDDKSSHSDLSFSCDIIYAKNTNQLSTALVKKTIKQLGYETFNDYFESIVNCPNSVKEFRGLMGILKDNGIRIKLYRSSRASQVDMINFDDENTIEEIIESNTKKQTDILINACGTKTIEPIGTHVSNFVKKSIMRSELGVVSGISTGFEVLDNAVNCLQKGNMYVFAARPKTGKTTFLVKLGDNIARQGIPVLYIDTEMDSEDEITPRLLSLYSRINNYWIINNSFVKVPDELEAVRNAELKLANVPFYHVYKPGITLPNLVSLIKAWILRNVGTYIDPITGTSKTKDCVVIFDYLKVAKRSKFVKDYQLLGEMTTVLKDLAGKYGFPCITAVQNNRASVKDMNGEVVNAETAVAGSDEILQYTNYLFFMDEIRSYNRIVNGVENKTYRSYIQGMTEEKFAAMFNQAVVTLDEKAKYNNINNLIGNRLLSLVAGRQASVHDDNNFFTISMDAKYSDISFTGELAYNPIGIPKRRG